MRVYAGGLVRCWRRLHSMTLEIKALEEKFNSVLLRRDVSVPVEASIKRDTTFEIVGYTQLCGKRLIELEEALGRPLAVRAVGQTLAVSCDLEASTTSEPPKAVHGIPSPSSTEVIGNHKWITLRISLPTSELIRYAADAFKAEFVLVQPNKLVIGIVQRGTAADALRRIRCPSKAAKTSSKRKSSTRWLTLLSTLMQPKQTKPLRAGGKRRFGN